MTGAAVLEGLPTGIGLAAAPPPLDIAAERCKGCELCVGACPHGVLALDLTVVNRLGYHPVRLTDPRGCTSCVLCARVCPDAVFTVYAPRKATRS
jgi:2-oxoglutarate ferredoxin oxidoreductase subunit delta